MSKFFRALENAERDRERPPAALETQPAGPPAGPAKPPPEPFPDILELPPARPPGELDDHLVSLLEPTSPAAEQYRKVCLHIKTLHRQRDVRLMAISSPGRGDGKTLSAINIAGALAQVPDAQVALVEVDLGRPGVARYLGLPNRGGLSSYLLNQAVSADAVLERPEGVGFAVVTAGPVSSRPDELLMSPRLRTLFAALRERFDFVVVDTPPLLPFSGAGLRPDLVDGFLLVVRANHTPRQTVHDSLRAVGSDRVFGVIFNDAEGAAVARHENGAGRRSAPARPLGSPRAG